MTEACLDWETEPLAVLFEVKELYCWSCLMKR